MSTRKEVFYTLSAQRGRGVIVPIATYRLYTDAHEDGMNLTRGYHSIIQRVSVPVNQPIDGDAFVWDDEKGSRDET